MPPIFSGGYQSISPYIKEKKTKSGKVIVRQAYQLLEKKKSKAENGLSLALRALKRKVCT